MIFYNIFRHNAHININKLLTVYHSLYFAYSIFCSIQQKMCMFYQFRMRIFRLF